MLSDSSQQRGFLFVSIRLLLIISFCKRVLCSPFLFTQTLRFDKTLNWIKVCSLSSLTKITFPYLPEVSNAASDKTFSGEITETVTKIKLPGHEWVDDEGLRSLPGKKKNLSMQVFLFHMQPEHLQRLQELLSFPAVSRCLFFTSRYLSL